MKLFGYLALGVLGASGCAGRLPEPRPPSMVRSFAGTLIPGYYVSPGAYQHYIQAQLLSNDGRAEEAAEELRHSLASDGASPYLRSRLAEELLNLGRIDEAREEVEAALHLDPQFPEAYVDLAKVKLRLGDGNGAEVALKRALEIDRGCEEAYLSLVGLYRERGHDAKVEETWREMVRHLPGSAVAHQALGRAAQSRGDVRAAETSFVRALELDPSLLDARVELAQLLQGEGRFVDAATQLEQAWQRSGDVKLVELIVRLDVASGREAQARELIDRLDDEGGGNERRIMVGWLRLAAHQPERARALGEELLRGGESAGARLLTGAALEALGKVEDALAQLRKVPPQARQFGKAQERLGVLLRDNGRYREAIDLLAKAIQSVAGDAPGSDVTDALNGILAGVHERAGDRAQGIKVLESALNRRPQSEALTFALGNAYSRSGDWERAVETVQKILKRDPDSVQALNFIGYVFAEHGVKLEEAQRLLTRAVALKPADGGIVDSLGWLYVKLGRLDEAERLLTRADRLAPEDPEILGHLGELYVKRADRVRAIESYKRALAHHPEERARRVMEEQILLLETGRVGSR
jgi:tetratricopeptide (TPR) repeat protein